MRKFSSKPITLSAANCAILRVYHCYPKYFTVAIINVFDSMAPRWYQATTNSMAPQTGPKFGLVQYQLTYRAIHTSSLCHFKADSRITPRQWEPALFCSNISDWLGASLESALVVRVVMWNELLHFFSEIVYRKWSLNHTRADHSLFFNLPWTIG